MKDPVEYFVTLSNKERVNQFKNDLKENPELAKIHNEMDEKIKQIMPNNFEIISSKYFYFDYFQKIKNDFAFELAALSLLLVVGLSTSNYLGVLFMICLYFLTDIVLHLHRFRMKLKILILEKAIKHCE
jgi:hypothetical protein